MGMNNEATPNGEQPAPGTENPAPSPDAGGESEGDHSEDQAARIATLEKRIHDQGRIIDEMRKAKKETAGDEKPKGNVSAVEEMMKKAEEREARANAKTVKAALMAGLRDQGVSENLARKVLPALQSEMNIELSEEDEVIIQTDSGPRSVNQFLSVHLQTDEWRDVLPSKTGARGVRHSGGQPAPERQGLSVSPSAGTVYSASEIRNSM